MENHTNKTKIYAGAITVLLLMSITGAGILMDMNGDLKGSLNSEQLKNEKLLSEKLTLDKEINNLKNELLSLSSSNTELLGQIEVAGTKIREQEKNINQIRKQNNSIRKEVDGMRKLKTQLENEIASLKTANQSLAEANGKMEKNISDLLAENGALKDRLKNAAVMRASNFRVEVMRKRGDKLTVKAHRTHQVSVSFDLPESAMANLGKSKVYMVITGPDGKSVAEAGTQKQTVFIDGVKTEFTPSAMQEVNLGKGQRLSLNYSPEDGLTEGLYKVEVYTDNTYLGNSQFRLMK
ncbi:hypothetical protein BH09BAC1_BH09BAC1_16140 [soil metagenome]